MVGTYATMNKIGTLDTIFTAYNGDISPNNYEMNRAENVNDGKDDKFIDFSFYSNIEDIEDRYVDSIFHT